MRGVIVLLVVTAIGGAAADEEILVNFEEGYKGKVYYQEFTGGKRRIVNWRLLEFDLEEKVVREVATFRTYLIRSDHIAKMSRDRRGLYVVGAPAETEDFGDYSLTIMAWDNGLQAFEVRRFITIHAAFWEHLTLVYLDWENALRINFFKLYTKHIEEWRRRTGAGEEEIFWDDCF